MKKMKKLKSIAALMSAVIMAFSAQAIPASAAETGKLPAPAGLTAAVTDSFDRISYQEASAGVDLTWSPVDGAKKYNVYMLKSGKYVKVDTNYASYYSESNKVWTAFVNYEYYDNYSRAGFNLAPDTVYSFKVAAVDKNDAVGSTSAAVSVKTPSFQPPRVAGDGAILNSGVTTTAAYINFRDTAWADTYEIIALFPGETKYRAIKKTDGITAALVDGPGKTYFISGLKPDTAYKFKIRASATIDGKKITSAYSKEIAVTTAKTVFTGKNADNITGLYGFGGGADNITFNEDGTGYFDYNATSAYSSKTHSFSYTAADKNGDVNVTIIGVDFVYEVSPADSGDWWFWPVLTPGESRLIKVTADSVREKGLDGKTFVYKKGDVTYTVYFPAHPSDLGKIQLSADPYSSGAEVYYQTKELSDSKLQITIDSEKDPVLLPYTFVYDKKKDTLTVTESSSAKNAIPKGTVMKVRYEYNAGEYVLAPGGASSPTLKLNANGTGTASGSGKSADFTYDITNNGIVLNFKDATDPVFRDLHQGKVFGRVYNWYTIVKADKAKTYNINDVYDKTVDTVQSAYDISTGGVWIIVIDGNAYVRDSN